MFFRKKRPPSPLSDLCGKCSQEFIAHFIQSGDPENESTRVLLLSYLIMYVADHFITRDLSPEKSEIWFNHKSIVTDNNKDVLMAETIMWLRFLIGRLWKSDKEYETREWWATLTNTNKLLVSTISDLTKVDFHNRAVEGRKLYLASEKERGDLQEVFVGRLITCLENKSLSESPKEISPAMAIMMPIDLTVRLHCAVSIFFATMPQAIYKTFKNALREYPEKFPWD